MSKLHQTPSPERSSSTPASGENSASDTSRASGGGGNALRQERLGLSPGSESNGEEQKTARVTLSARKGGSPFSSEFWTELNVGHCWVDVVTPEGRKDSWGYTASNPRSFPRYQPWKSVPGRVLHPDGSRGATGTLSREVDADQLKQGEDWGKSAGGTYNLFGFDGGHSCATFARGFFEASTGESAPSSMFGALIASPNDLSAAVNRQVEKERKNGDQTDSLDNEQASD
jgi:hypothetical protein